MTAQIEPNPRSGVELKEPWTWRDWLAMSASYLLLGLVLFALWFPDPFSFRLLTGAAAAILVVAYGLDALRKRKPQPTTPRSTAP
ncbi:hypothetical protein J5226_12765 [Lysobacter sp. K5869]|uniref:hypothetical protein n=1 Tax=Lysobacter sp. K5869 TaxID=2820808 RepID=UPI001C062B26|nr:hypothetical protein [Lysobacter sp. K5869]QWP79197.1 hypothetical protein J5226_12765 [Lysobacter sp. K5869]